MPSLVTAASQRKSLGYTDRLDLFNVFSRKLWHIENARRESHEARDWALVEVEIEKWIFRWLSGCSIPLEELAGSDGTHTVLLLVGRNEENIISLCKPIARLISVAVVLPVWQDGERAPLPRGNSRTLTCSSWVREVTLWKVSGCALHRPKKSTNSSSKNRGSKTHKTITYLVTATHLDLVTLLIAHWAPCKKTNCLANLNGDKEGYKCA